MGWFTNSGPTINSRVESSVTIWFSHCVCGNKHEDRRKHRVESQVKKCVNAQKEKEEKIKAKDRKKALEEKHAERKARAERAERAERERHEREVDRLKKQMLNTQRKLKKEAKSQKCVWCKSHPCKGTKPECAKLRAARLQSSMSMDMGDPATFDDQLRWYRDNMQ